MNDEKATLNMRHAKKTDDDRGPGAGRTARRITLHDDGGQSLVELALIVPIFALLLLGAVAFGQLAYAAIEVSNAARAGVAYGAQSAATAADTAGMQAAAIDDAANISGMKVAAQPFCTCSNDPTSTHLSDCGSAPATCEAEGAHAINYVQVNTTATVTPIASYPGISPTFTLSGQAIMRVE